MVIIGASVGNQVGQEDSPTLEIKMEIQNIIYKKNFKISFMKFTLAKYKARRTQLIAVDKFWMAKNIFAAFNL